MQILFEPHATTTDNEAKLSSGWNDVDLSEFGYQNSNDLRERYAEAPPELVFCSDLQRSYKTAAIAFEGTGVKLIIDRRLRECDYGDLTQAPKEVVEGQKRDRIKKSFPNGESYEDALSRMQDFIDSLEAYKVQRIMIIGHRATQYGLEVILNNKSLEQAVTEPWQWQPGWEYQL